MEIHVVGCSRAIQNSLIAAELPEILSFMSFDDLTPVQKRHPYLPLKIQEPSPTDLRFIAQQNKRLGLSHDLRLLLWERGEAERCTVAEWMMLRSYKKRLLAYEMRVRHVVTLCCEQEHELCLLYEGLSDTPISIGEGGPQLPPPSLRSIFDQM